MDQKNCPECIVDHKADFKIAIPIAVFFIFIFVYLQKTEVLNLLDSSKFNYSTAFFIGVIASLSSCVAVVGGLVLSISTNFALKNEKYKSQLLFHVFRLISFFVFGGMIGAFGLIFKLGIYGNFILNVLIAIVLIILGINLLQIFPQIKKIQPTLPNFLRERIQNLKNLNSTLTPALLGAATFFLPCGFTQSMQLYTLTSGGFLNGALTMFIFSVGTLPVLAFLSIGSVRLSKSKNVGIFFKSAGLVVVFLGALNLFNSFSIFSISDTEFRKEAIEKYSTENVEIIDGKQIIEINARGGYLPMITLAKANVETVLKVKTVNTYDCSTALIIPQINYSEILPPTADTIINLPPQTSGSELRGTCSMGMYGFRIRFE